VQCELEARWEETDRLRRTQVERARYEAELARRRFLRVDPDNRLVGASLESDWNEKLRALAEAEQHYERQRQRDDQSLDSSQRKQILSLATDFPRLWRDPNTPHRERKRMVRLLIEDVTLRKADQIEVSVRFRGGVNKTFSLPRPLNYFQKPQAQLGGDHRDRSAVGLPQPWGDRYYLEQERLQNRRRC